MNASRRGPHAPPHELGQLLRYWRDVRGVSQLDLSLDAGISQRQISFIESGRSVPGRDTLLTLAQTLDVPLRGATRCCSRPGMHRCIRKRRGMRRRCRA